MKLPSFFSFTLMSTLILVSFTGFILDSEEITTEEVNGTEINTSVENVPEISTGGEILAILLPETVPQDKNREGGEALRTLN